MRRLLALALAALLPQAAAAQSVDAGYPHTVMTALTEMGRNPVAKTYESGRSFVVFDIGSGQGRLTYYGCNDAFANCKDLIFATGWGEVPGVTLDTLNKWNREWFITPAIQNTDGTISLTYNMVHAQRIPPEQFRATIERIERAIGRFSKALAPGSAGLQANLPEERVDDGAPLPALQSLD
ncbi:hypothetical protein DXV76_05010 [Rhodobacteraceae bacterium CCMM004]|nr:hypothetical protein DXV76_05010 [Rhodobacteraceae bacterium CCMM004]